MHPLINLISDTVTRPTPDMLSAMMRATVGDDVFQEDPTVNELQAYAASLFGMEAALFCPSGTMTNQIALQVHCGRLEEVICDKLSHIFQYETGGYASNGGIPIQLLDGTNGKLIAEQVQAAIRPDYDWLPTSRLVVLENTCNKGGGSYYTLPEMQAIREVTEAHGLKLHLDGARLFNALAETGDTPEAIGATFDTISICLSKGLGAPVGSLLLGSHEDMRQARRLRKAMGGGMRQAGYLAAAGLYALQHHRDRLAEDNRHAALLADTVRQLPYVIDVRPVRSNILIFDLEETLTAEAFLERLKSHGILAAPFGPHTVRFVTHYDVSAEQIERVREVLERGV